MWNSFKNELHIIYKKAHRSSLRASKAFRAYLLPFTVVFLSVGLCEPAMASSAEESSLGSAVLAFLFTAVVFAVVLAAVFWGMDND